jgi:hypothetical protein
MKPTKLARTGIVVAVCAAAGALAGIAGSAAAPSKTKAKSSSTTTQQSAPSTKPGHDGPFGRHGPGGGAVHSEAVVPNQAGTGFVNVTTDSGTLNSVDGTTVDLKEGTDTKTYDASVKVDVGDNAKVYRDGQTAQLSDLKAGDHVTVIQSPEGNVVQAASDSWLAQRDKDHDGHGPPGGP